jgi:hypothetical protein
VALSGRGVPASDTREYFKRAGFSDFKSKKQLTKEDLEERGENDYFNLTPATLERVKTFSAERRKQLDEGLKTRLLSDGDFSDEELKALQENYDVSKEHLDYLLNNNPDIKAERERRLQVYKQSKASSKETPYFAELEARKQAGWITPEDEERLKPRIAEEREAERQLKEVFSKSLFFTAQDYAPDAIDSMGQALPKETAQQREERLNAYLKSELGSKTAKDYLKTHLENESKDILYKSIEAGKNFVKVFPKVLSTAAKVGGIGQEYLTRLGNITLDWSLGKDEKEIDKIWDDPQFKAVNTGIYRFGQELDAKIEKDFSFDEGLKQSFLVTQAPDAIGQVVSQTLLGIVTGGASVPVAFGLSQGAVEQYDTADKAKASTTQRLVSSALGGLFAVPDALLSARFAGLALPKKLEFLSNFKNSIFTKLVGEVGKKEAKVLAESTVAAFFKSLPKNVAQGVVFEGIQETGEKKANEFVADITYNNKSTSEAFKRAVTLTREDIKEGLAGAVGGAFGGGIQTAVETSQQFSASDEIAQLLKKPLIDENLIGQRGINEKAKQPRLVRTDFGQVTVSDDQTGTTANTLKVETDNGETQVISQNDITEDVKIQELKPVIQSSPPKILKKDEKTQNAQEQTSMESKPLAEDKLVEDKVEISDAVEPVRANPVATKEVTEKPLTDVLTDEQASEQPVKELPRLTKPATLETKALVTDEIDEPRRRRVKGEVVPSQTNNANIHKVDGYNFTNTPTLTKGDGLFVKPATIDEDRTFYIAGTKVVQKEWKQRENGWYSAQEDNDVIVYAPATKESVIIGHKKGGRTGIAVSDFIGNNPRPSVDQAKVEYQYSDNKPTPQVTDKVKQPYEMTLEEFIDRELQHLPAKQRTFNRRFEVEKDYKQALQVALKYGKSVPDAIKQANPSVVDKANQAIAKESRRKEVISLAEQGVISDDLPYPVFLMTMGFFPKADAIAHIKKSNSSSVDVQQEYRKGITRWKQTYGKAEQKGEVQIWNKAKVDRVISNSPQPNFFRFVEDTVNSYVPSLIMSERDKFTPQEFAELLKSRFDLKTPKNMLAYQALMNAEPTLEIGRTNAGVYVRGRFKGNNAKAKISNKTVESGNIQPSNSTPPKNETTRSKPTIDFIPTETLAKLKGKTIEIIPVSEKTGKKLKPIKVPLDEHIAEEQKDIQDRLDVLQKLKDCVNG